LGGKKRGEISKPSDPRKIKELRGTVMNGIQETGSDLRYKERKVGIILPSRRKKEKSTPKVSRWEKKISTTQRGDHIRFFNRADRGFKNRESRG